MPDPSIGEQLAALLDETGMSQRSLGKRLAELQGKGMERFRERWEAQTRYIQKLIGTPEMRPGRRKLNELETALKRPGYFVVPAARPRQTVPKESTASRLATLEAEVVFLREWVGRGFAALGVAPELQDEARRASTANGTPS